MSSASSHALRTLASVVGERARPTRILSLAMLLAAIVCVLLNLPSLYYLPDAMLEGSWAYVLHSRAGQGGFGKGLIFTYGPLGFLVTLGDVPATYLWRVGFSSFLLLCLAGISILLRRRSDGSVLNWRDAVFFPLYVALVISYAFSGQDLTPDSAPILILVFGAVCLFRLSAPADRGLRIAIGLLFACLALVKGTMAFVVLAFLALWLLRRIASGRGSYDVVWAIIGGVLGLWLVSGNALSDVPQYLWATKEIAGGYSAAMRLSGRHEYQMRALFVVLACMFAWRVALMEGLKGADRWAMAVFVSLVGLLLAKHGTERFDEHVYGPSFIFLTLALVSFWLPSDMPRSRWLSVVLLVLALVTMHRAFVTQQGKNYPARDVFLGERLVQFWKWEWAAISQGRTIIAEQPARYEMSRQTLARRLPRVPEGATVDEYSFRQGLVIAQGLNYRPRPVFQSFIAYTPWLAEQNLAFLRSPAAAERIFFAVEPIDGRLASMEDGLSWFDLMTRYRLQGVFKVANVLHLHMVKLAQPGQFTLQAPQVRNLAIGTWLDVPAGEVVWAKGKVTRSSMMKKLRSQIAGAPIFWFEAKLADGTVARRRLIDAMLPSGFLVTPLVDTTQEFLFLATSARGELLKNKRVREFRITCASGDTCPAAEWEFSLSGVALNTDASWNAEVLSARPEGLTPLDALEAGVVTPGEASVRDGDGKKVFYAHPISASEVPVRDLVAAGAKRIRVCFGILAKAYEEGTTDGVVFLVDEILPSGERRTVLQRTLQPKTVAQDRGEQCADVKLSGEQTTLIFTTGPGASADWDWSYWSDVRGID